jgi:hypothetical protein
MTTMMEENEMKELCRIREDFLADARRHLFASDTVRGQPQNATWNNTDRQRPSAVESRSGQAGA